MQNTTHSLPARSEVPPEHTWDLRKLFSDDSEWEKGLLAYDTEAERLVAFKGTLGDGPDRLRAALDLMKEIGLLSERLSYYAHLRVAEDVGDSKAQARWSRFLAIATKHSGQTSFLTPEIQAIPDDQMADWLASDTLAPYRILLKQWLRFKPHILSEAEERLLALQAEFAGVSRQAFDALTDVDMQFGSVTVPDEGARPLTHATYGEFMQHADRAVRREAYTKYIAAFDAHKHTLTALYNGSVQRDVYQARVRRHPSALAMSLFPDNVPLAVYDQLIQAVRGHLPVLHRYYEVRRRALRLDELRLYDTRVPLVPDIVWTHTYEEATERVIKSLAILGEDYTQPLKEGLLGRWVDRYENKGKRSGAFSAGSFTGDPYILMNYNEKVLGDVFTLTHEAGHSMHTWYSARNQAFQDYGYTIFVAEVASTFNEQCLAKQLMEEATDQRQRTYLINKQIDDMLATLFRQTMFAEFERTTHEMAERNEPLTVDSLNDVYKELLHAYFGPNVPLEEHSPLEGLRIPHFYSAFYVYKYATGMSAAIALHERVTKGGVDARDEYLAFLKSGGSKYPLEQLADAGVDMRSRAPVDTALARFASLVDELEAALL